MNVNLFNLYKLSHELRQDSEKCQELKEKFLEQYPHVMKLPALEHNLVPYIQFQGEDVIKANIFPIQLSPEISSEESKIMIDIYNIVRSTVDLIGQPAKVSNVREEEKNEKKEEDEKKEEFSRKRKATEYEDDLDHIFFSREEWMARIRNLAVEIKKEILEEEWYGVKTKEESKMKREKDEDEEEEDGDDEIEDEESNPFEMDSQIEQKLNKRGFEFERTTILVRDVGVEDKATGGTIIIPRGEIVHVFKNDLGTHLVVTRGGKVLQDCISECQ